MDKENVIGFEPLYNSMMKCKKGVRWKSTTGFYLHHWVDELSKLSDQLANGTYKERHPRFFKVTEPKEREIMSIHFRDRIYQRSLNDVAIYPQTSQSYILDNYACQKGKGTNAARDRLRDFLRAYFRKYGTSGYALKIDIKGYYPNMDRAFAMDMLKRYIDEETFEMASGVISHYPGEVGFNPGSQIVQIIGITALDEVDHFIKERLRVRFYIRYMDDFILLHPDTDFLLHCKEEIERRLSERKMRLNEPKTFIQPITEPILFLGFVYRLSNTGKVIVLCDPKKIKHERRKIVRMIPFVKRGEMTKHDLDVHFKAWKASVSYGNSRHLIERLNKWYIDITKGL